MFGGVNEKGELQGTLRNLKLFSQDGIVKYSEWLKVDNAMSGQPPCPRIGHTLNYLPSNKLLVVAGGRNDTLAKGQPSPFLNDLYVYNLGVSLDKQQWYRVTLSDTLGNKDQELLNKVCNHTAAVWSDREHFDKLIILGGVQS